MKSVVKIPSGVWALGFVSLFMDASSELVHSLLPALFVSLGIGMSTVGIIEGVAEATASITKLFSGVLIPIPIKNHLCAQSRSPMDIILQGWSMSWFQAKQQ